MTRLLAFAAAALIGAVFSLSARAAPPYDVTATFTAAPGATSHRLYRGCAAGQTKTLVGTVASGQTFTGLVTAAGTYSFCVHGVNSAGEGPASNIVGVTISDLPDVPGQPTNLVITVTCANHPSGSPSCSVVVSP